MVEAHFRKTWAEINLSAIKENYSLLLSTLGDRAGLCPMVKANAYGHGLIDVAKSLEYMEPVGFGVALVEEGIELRQAGILTPILVFATFDEISLGACRKHQLTPVVSRKSEIELLKSFFRDVGFHLKINTGMNRLGMDPALAKQVVGKATSLRNLVGLCTHLHSSADFYDKSSTSLAQLKIFADYVDDVDGWNLAIHWGSSAPIISGYVLHGNPLDRVEEQIPSFTKSQMKFFRPGISLYGCSPTEKILSDLRPAMSLKSQIVHFQNLKRGEIVSYGGTFRASKEMKIAVLPVGYGDGYLRCLSNKASVVVREEVCPVVGRVCMDYLMISLEEHTQKDQLLIGESVLLFGETNLGAQSAVRVETLAYHANTIGYEVLTNINSRIPRRYTP